MKPSLHRSDSSTTAGVQADADIESKGDIESNDRMEPAEQDGADDNSPSHRREVEEKLLAGVSARKRMRRWVSGTLVTISIVLRAASYAWLLPFFTEDVATCEAFAFLWACAVSALISLSAAPLRDDWKLTRIVIFVHICATATEAYFNLEGLWDAQAESMAWVGVDVVFIFFLLVAMARKGATNIQQGLWRALQIFFALSLTATVVLALQFNCSCCLHYLPATSAGLALSLWPGFRGKIRHKLAKLYDRHSAKAAAASIAGLMGHCTVSEVMSQASARFRSIRADLIYEEDMLRKDPDPSLYMRSEPARLGSCDAFVSHSWSDNPEGKWEVFQEWREEFVFLHGREPTIWLDKCCIDQTNIEADLRCLPIFLSGCKELVVLCGTTYFSRLWCIVELFTHYHMGLGSKNLTVKLVLSRNNTRSDLDVVTKAVTNFDVNESQCASPRDRNEIMQIILASFSSSSSFNQVVREVLLSSGVVRSIECESHSVRDWLSRCESVSDAGAAVGRRTFSNLSYVKSNLSTVKEEAEQSAKTPSSAVAEGAEQSAKMPRQWPSGAARSSKHAYFCRFWSCFVDCREPYLCSERE